ncbi:MAG: hypothetical protein PUD81_02305 [Eggerthellales bacterium]|nr:hypothetical protein [Eggerthellales bacterium]
MAFKLADDTWVDTTVTLDKLAGTLTIEGGLPPQAAGGRWRIHH